MERRELLAVLTAEDHLLREQPGAGEERAVGGLHIARDERIGPLVHDLLGGGSGLAQEFVVGVILGLPRFVGRRLARVVLAEGAFIEADARLEGQCHPLVDERRAFRELGVGEAVGACEGEVFQHFVHDVLAAVAGFHHRLLVAGRDREVVPGHGAEGLHLVVVEPGAPETGCAFVVVVGSFGEPLRLAHVHQEIVDVVDRRPVADRPAALQVGCPRGVGQERERLFGGHDVRVPVAVAQVCCAGGVFLDEPVGIGQQGAFVREIIPGSDLGVGIPVKEILAGREQETGRKQNICYLFHCRP